MKNIITGKTLAETVQLLGYKEALRQFAVRGTGRTTGLVLLWLGESISNPGKWIRLTDHDHECRPANSWSNLALFSNTKARATQLGLVGLEFDDVRGIRFTPIVVE